MFDMESQWNYFEHIFFHEIVILFHVVEKCFFVTNKIVELKMIMDFFIHWIFSLFEEILFKIFNSI